MHLVCTGVGNLILWGSTRSAQSLGEQLRKGLPLALGLQAHQYEVAAPVSSSVILHTPAYNHGCVFTY